MGAKAPVTGWAVSWSLGQNHPTPTLCPTSLLALINYPVTLTFGFRCDHLRRNLGSSWVAQRRLDASLPVVTG